MIGDENGPLLTDTKKEVLRGEYDATSRQAEYDHRSTIRNNTGGALRDLQYLFQHLEQSELKTVVQKGYETDETEKTLIPYDNHQEAVYGMTPLNPEYYDESGRPRDPEYNPDAKTKFQKWAEEKEGTQKASPETQQTLIDCVGFLCRAAEAGSLNIDELIERGVERYYRGNPNKDDRIVHLRAWREKEYRDRIVGDYEGVEYPNDLPKMGRGALRLLAREGYEI